MASASVRLGPPLRFISTPPPPGAGSLVLEMADRLECGAAGPLRGNQAQLSGSSAGAEAIFTRTAYRLGIAASHSARRPYRAARCTRERSEAASQRRSEAVGVIGAG